MHHNISESNQIKWNWTPVNSYETKLCWYDFKENEKNCFRVRKKKHT